MFIVAVTFEIDPAHREAFRDAMLTQARNSLANEPACKQFDVCYDDAKPDSCFLYEKYDDAAAFETHKSTDHFKSYDATVGPWIVNKTVNTWHQFDL